MEVEGAGDFVAVDRDNEVAADGDALHAGAHHAITAVNASRGCGAALGCRFHQEAFLRGKIECFRELAGYRNRLYAQESLVNAAIGHEIVRDAFGAVDRNGEADAGGGAAGRVDRGVDADHFTARIDQRAAGVAAIDGGVGLNGFIDEGGLAGLHGAADGADYAGGQCALKTKWIADGENFLAYLESSGIA